MPAKPTPVRDTFGNVIRLEQCLHPLSCPRCRCNAVSQVDQMEFAYPVKGVRPRSDVIHIDFTESHTDVAATADPFYRCRLCGHEWPVEAGTTFVDARV